MKVTQYLTHPHTGVVDTKENWLSDMSSWYIEGEEDLEPHEIAEKQQEQFEELEEVFKNYKGEFLTAGEYHEEVKDFIHAIYHSDVEKVREFLEQGFDPNTLILKDFAGYLTGNAQTVLSLACYTAAVGSHGAIGKTGSIASNGSTEVAELLIKAGADVNLQDINNNNSLSYAAQASFMILAVSGSTGDQSSAINMTSFLLEKGAEYYSLNQITSEIKVVIADYEAKQLHKAIEDSSKPEQSVNPVQIHEGEKMGTRNLGYIELDIQEIPVRIEIQDADEPYQNFRMEDDKYEWQNIDVPVVISIENTIYDDIAAQRGNEGEWMTFDPSYGSHHSRLSDIEEQLEDLGVNSEEFIRELEAKVSEFGKYIYNFSSTLEASNEILKATAEARRLESEIKDEPIFKSRQQVRL